MLTFRKITKDDPAVPVLNQVNDEAFPPVERIPFADMLRSAEKGNVTVWGFFRDGEAAGFAMTVCSAGCAYISYFAVKDSMRGQGLGSEALRALFRQYPDRQMVLDMEPVETAAENYSQRQRRRAFYLRNGFHETGRFTMMRGVRYAVLCSGGDLDTDSFETILRQEHLLNPESSVILY